MRLHALPCVTRCRRGGGVTPLTLLSLSLLVGVAAIAVDGGTLMEARRQVQASADAAALAAAADLYANYHTNQGTDPKGTAAASALATSAANGFSNDGVQSIVTVNISPQNYEGGPNTGTSLPAGYAEVLVQYNAGRLFSGVFGSGAIPVRGRAVARGIVASVGPSLTALSLHASSALAVSGTASLKINGAVLVNSDSSSAIKIGGSASLTATVFNLVGGVGNLLGGLLGLLGLGGGTANVQSITSVPDPLRYLPAPDSVQLGLPSQSATNLVIRSNTDLYPGVYSGGILVRDGASVVLHANSDGTPGIYFLQGGGFTISGNSTSVSTAASETAGVMIYNNWQSRSMDVINLGGSGKLTLTPPRSGPYKGITIFQKRGTSSSAAPSITIAAQGTTNIVGTIYGAYAKVNLSSQSSTNVLGGQIVADTLAVSGSVNVNINAGTQPVAVTRTFGLVE
jgi:Flp pilus assembly protein TadG